MGEKTSIEWTDSSWNPWLGCTKVSPACDDCYAARSTPARTLGVEWGAGQPRKRTSAANWKLPERWNREQFYECSCGQRGGESLSCPIMCGGHLKPARRRVFCASLADWLDNEVPVEWLVGLLDLIRGTPNLDWLLLTKRIGNWRKRLGEALNASNSVELREWLALWLNGDAPRNAWLGATVVNQVEADRDVPKLLAVPARVRFLSMEPLLGPVDLAPFLKPDRHWDEDGSTRRSIVGGAKLHWAITGGESGPQARPSHPDWYRALRDQCVAAGVAYHFKQWGEWAPGPFDADTPENLRLRSGEYAHVFDDGVQVGRVGKKAAGRLLDGREWNEFPR